MVCNGPNPGISCGNDTPTQFNDFMLWELAQKCTHGGSTACYDYMADAGDIIKDFSNTLMINNHPTPAGNAIVASVIDRGVSSSQVNYQNAPGAGPNYFDDTQVIALPAAGTPKKFMTWYARNQTTAISLCGYGAGLWLSYEDSSSGLSGFCAEYLSFGISSTPGTTYTFVPSANLFGFSNGAYWGTCTVCASLDNSLNDITGFPDTWDIGAIQAAYGSTPLYNAQGALKFQIMKYYPRSTDPGTGLADGWTWYNSTDHMLKARINGVTVPWGGGGLADPGANGFVYRTALNTTAIGTLSQLIAAYWSDSSCSLNSTLQKDGTCITPSGSAYTGTSPIVVTGTVISCPTCSTGTGTSVSLPGAASLGSLTMNGNVGLLCADSSGSGTAQVCTTTPSITPAAGTCFTYTTTTTNSGTGLTLNIDSFGAKSVAVASSSGWTTTLVASASIPANKPMLMCYDGTNLNASGTGVAPGGGGATLPAFKQYAYIGETSPGGSSLTTLAPISVVAGDLLVTACRGAANTSAVVTDTLSNTWTMLPVAGSTVTVQMGWAIASSSGSNSFTCTWAGGVGHGSIVAMEFTGAETTANTNNGTLPGGINPYFTGAYTTTQRTLQILCASQAGTSALYLFGSLGGYPSTTVASSSNGLATGADLGCAYAVVPMAISNQVGSLYSSTALYTGQVLAFNY